MKTHFPSAEEYSAEKARYPGLTVVDIDACQRAVAVPVVEGGHRRFAEQCRRRWAPHRHVGTQSLREFWPQGMTEEQCPQQRSAVALDVWVDEAIARRVDVTERWRVRTPSDRPLSIVTVCHDRLGSLPITRAATRFPGPDSRRSSKRRRRSASRTPSSCFWICMRSWSFSDRSLRFSSSTPISAKYASHAPLTAWTPVSTSFSAGARISSSQDRMNPALPVCDV